MRTRLAVAATAMLLGLTLAVSAAPPAPAPAAPPEAAGPGGLDLSIRARSLGLVPVTPEATLGLEPMRAPTGAGTTRWPSAVTELAPGVYLHVAPTCLPGEDPLSPRRFAPLRRR